MPVIAVTPVISARRRPPPDGGAPQLLEGFFVMPPNNHGWRGGHVLLAKLVEAPKPGKHRLRFRLLESRHPESGGHQFRLEYLLVR